MYTWHDMLPFPNLFSFSPIFLQNLRHAWSLPRYLTFYNAHFGVLLDTTGIAFTPQTHLSSLESN